MAVHGDAAERPDVDALLDTGRAADPFLSSGGFSKFDGIPPRHAMIASTALSFTGDRWLVGIPHLMSTGNSIADRVG